MKKITLCLLLSGLGMTFAVANPTGLLLDDFNSGVTSGEGEVVVGSTWQNQVTQNPTTLTIGGTALDDNGWASTTVTIDGTSFSQLVIIGQRDAGHNDVNSFKIEFTDGSFNTNIFSVATTSFNIGSLTTVTIPVSWTGPFDATNIVGWSIGGGSSSGGSFAFRMTLDNLALTAATAVPEPSTYAMLTGILAVGVVAWRRRQARA